MKLTVNPELIDNEFLFYFFKSDYGQYQILKHESQVGVPSISNPLTSLKEIDVPVPPLPEQLSIASILISLDDKIDLLHRQNETLEAMAETIFRQWFIEQAEDDWNMEPLDSIIDFNPRYKLSKGTDAIYLEMSNVSENSFHPKDWYIRTFASGTKFMNGDTLLARITPCLENGKTCFVYFLNDEEVGWGSTEYIVMRMKPGYHPFLSYIIAKNEEFRDFAESSMTGSSGRQRAQADVIKTFEIQIPPQPIIDKLNEQVDSIFDKLKNNATQIKSLESLRDTLLPKLMSGEVRVKN
jgi:type I restriction enzyme S subunit